MVYAKDRPQKYEEKYTEEGVKQRLAMLIGRKNLSIDFGASEEMYDFIQYCISYGIFIGKSDRSIEDQAKDAYHHYEHTVLSQTL